MTYETHNTQLRLVHHIYESSLRGLNVVMVGKWLLMVSFLNIYKERQNKLAGWTSNVVSCETQPLITAGINIADTDQHVTNTYSSI